MIKSTLGRNAVLNGIKTACSIFFPFISFSYCSRIIGADGLGAYSFGQSIIAYLLLVSTLGIPNYAIREGSIVREDREKLNNFVSQVFTINLIMTVISYIILIVLLVTWPKLQDYRYIVMIQSIQIILTTIGADWINSIYEDYFYLAIRYIVIQLLSIVALVLFIKSPEDIYLYAFISMLSNAGGNILNLRYIQKKGIVLKVTKHINIKRHLFPVFILFFNSLASIVYLNSDITMLGVFCDNSSVGIYTVSSKIYAMIKSLINSIILVTLPRFTTYVIKKEKEQYKNKICDLQEILFLITTPVMVGIFLEGKKILNLVAGPDYLSGAVVVQLLALAIPFAVEACFFTYAILMPNRCEKKFLLSTVVAAILNIALNIILLPRYGMYAAAVTTLIAEISVVGITFYYSRQIVNLRLSKKIVMQVLLSNCCLIITCIFIDNLSIAESFKLILDIFVGALVYGFSLYLMKCKWIIECLKRYRKCKKNKV